MVLCNILLTVSRRLEDVFRLGSSPTSEVEGGTGVAAEGDWSLPSEDVLMIMEPCKR